MARIRSVPEDFRVEEVALYPPCGDGDHTFVRIEKRLRNTDDVAVDLAHAAGVDPRDVGYAGRKDRDAVTTQTFSVPGLDPAAALALSVRGVRVLEAIPHRHKLRVGQLKANRFEIRVREMSTEMREAARVRLVELEATGMPNRFGSQRFGRDGRNAVLGARLLSGKSRQQNRRKARFLISAFQSMVFNDVLEARELPAGTLEQGDVAVIHASGGLFIVEDTSVEQPRADAFEISPTGPIFGSRVIQPLHAAAAREAEALAAHGVSLDRIAPPPGIRLRGARRALRVQPADARIRDTDDGMWLDFTLPAGSYATVLIREILGEEPIEAVRDDTMSRVELC